MVMRMLLKGEGVRARVLASLGFDDVERLPVVVVVLVAAGKGTAGT